MDELFIALVCLCSYVYQIAVSTVSVFREMYETFVTIFDVKTLKTKVLIEGHFAKKVRKWLGNNEDLFQEAHDQVRVKN